MTFNDHFSYVSNIMIITACNIATVKLRYSHRNRGILVQASR